jgi:signal transduction histidine kinase
MSILNSLRQHFGTIRWKLTGTYVLVSLLLALTLIVIALAAGWLFFSSQFILTEIHKDAHNFAAVLRPEFASPARNGERLGRSLLLATTGGSQGIRLQPTTSAQPGDDTQASLQVGIDPAEGSQEPGLFIALLDEQGRVLTTTLPGYVTGSPLYYREPEGARDVVNAALLGITDTSRLVAWSMPDRQPLVAEPVLDDTGKVLGVVYMRITNFPSPRTLLSIIPPFLLGTILPWLLISSGVGMLYGWVAGRGFSRRLRRVTEASAALAQGDLSQRVEDRSNDEIGQLARQFNAMADQLAANLRELRLLADQNAQLAEQAALLAVVEERNRLARDLHDSVSQELFSLTMLAAASQRILPTRPEVAAGQLAEMESTARRALQETRSLILALRPAMLDDRGLAAALRDLTTTALERQGLQVSLSISGERRLPLEQEQALFRIVQEALANVVRHSEVRAAEVVLCYDNDQICLTVSDAGHGFDPQAPRSARSLGLHSMAERAAALGGSFAARSTPGQGTTVEVRLPAGDKVRV